VSGIDNVKAAQGFVPAKERPRCANCRHHETTYVERMPPFDRAGLRCRKGGFAVSAYAWCAQYEAPPCRAPQVHP